MTDRFTAKFCPLKVDRSETGTTCLAYGTKPADRYRCTAEVKAAGRVAANYFRKHSERGITRACEEGGIWHNQLIGENGYFESKEEILATPMDYIGKRRSGTDPGEVGVGMIATVVPTTVAKGSVIGHFSSVEIRAKINELEKTFIVREKEEEKVTKSIEKVEKAMDVLRGYGIDVELVITP